MIVVSDTTPINYLLQLDLVELLRDLYGTVYLPSAVLRELEAEGSLKTVRAWAGDLPEWVVVRGLQREIPDEFLHLDAGEAEALTLALEIGADVVLLDERKGRKAAEACGLEAAGTLAVLRDSAVAGRIDFDEEVSRLRSLNFRVSDEIIDDARPPRP